MSAKYDRSQKIIFIYKNMHQAYKNEKNPPSNPVSDLKKDLKTLDDLNAEMKALIEDLEKILKKI